MIVKETHTKRQNLKAVKFLSFLLNPGNESYLRAYYDWFEKEAKARVKQTNQSLSDFTYIDAEKLMIEYCKRGLQLTQSFDKSRFSDEEIRMFYPKSN
jgi:hypothetical protein